MTCFGSFQVFVLALRLVQKLWLLVERLLEPWLALLQLVFFVGLVLLWPLLLELFPFFLFLVCPSFVLVAEVEHLLLESRFALVLEFILSSPLQLVHLESLLRDTPVVALPLPLLERRLSLVSLVDTSFHSSSPQLHF